MSDSRWGRSPEWAAVIAEHAVEDSTARRLIGQLLAVEVASLAFCRLLERWARGEPEPSTPGRRQAALRRAADRVETALAGLEQPLGRYLLELEADSRGGTLVVRRTEPRRARRLAAGADPRRRARSSRIASPGRYLELAVLVRALEGLCLASALRS